MKIQKKIFFFFWGGGRVGGGGLRLGGGQGGCERRSEVFVKIQKKNLRGGGRGRMVGGGGVGDLIRGWDGGGSKVWGRWVMWGMEVVNQE